MFNTVLLNLPEAQILTQGKEKNKYLNKFPILFCTFPIPARLFARSRFRLK
jgi:hypothetical protein